jgi:hypothetical protein
MSDEDYENEMSKVLHDPREVSLAKLLTMPTPLLVAIPDEEINAQERSEIYGRLSALADRVAKWTTGERARRLRQIADWAERKEMKSR